MRKFSALLLLIAAPAFAGERVKVRQSVTVASDSPLRTRAAALRDRAAELATRQPVRSALRSVGCAGASFAHRERFTAVVRVRERFADRPQRTYGCAGATFAPPPAGGPVLVPAAPPAAEPLGAGPLQRRRVERQLSRALREGDMTPAQAADVMKIMRNPKKYDKLVDHVHAELSRKAATGPGMQAIGDGRLRDLILAWLPTILEIIKQILAELSFVVPPFGWECWPLPVPEVVPAGYLPMPRAVPAAWGAC